MPTVTVLRTPRPRTFHLFQPKQLEKVEYFRIEEGGFQRDLIQSKAAAIADYLLNDPVGEVPAIMLARVKQDKKSGRLWSVDGQHRTQGAVLAGVPIYVEIVEVETMDEARLMFLKNNSTATKMHRQVLLAASNTPVASKTKELAASYEARCDHIVRLVTGLTSGTTSSFYDITNPRVVIPKDVISLVKIVMDEWTNDDRWLPSAFPPEPKGTQQRSVARKIVNTTKSAYCVPGVLQSVGDVLRKLQLTAADKTTVKRVLKIMKDGINWKAPNVRQEAGRSGMDYFCRLSDSFRDKISSEAIRSGGLGRSRKQKRELVSA